MQQEQYTHTDTDGSKFYYKDNAKTILHRLDGPALEYSDGHKEWRKNGIIHREDGPAIEYQDGTKAWYINSIFIFSLKRNGEVVGKMSRWL